MGCFCRALSETRNHLPYVPSTDATSVNDMLYNFFVLDEERLIPVNFHFVKTACLCMSFVLTTRLQIVSTACSAKSKENWMDHR